MIIIGDSPKISFLILSEFKWVNQLLFPLKLSKNQMSSDDFRQKTIDLNWFNIRNEVWWQIEADSQASPNFSKK